jgi:hypothetical protein
MDIIHLTKVDLIKQACETLLMRDYDLVCVPL